MSDPRQSPRDPEQLARAFASFTAASDRLEAAYARLESEVSALQAALAVTAGERDQARAEQAAAVTRQRKLDQLLARHQRLAAMGEMAATLAHQIRTPLSAALLYAGNAANPALPAPRRDELLGRAIACLNDLEKLVGDMLGFARGATAASTPVALNDLACAVRNCAPTLIRPGQRLEVAEADANVVLRANREALVGALLNLVTNALQAGGASAQVRLDWRLAGQFAELRVTDNGPGVPASQRQQIFDPFYTTRPEGTGLGLAVVRSVAEAHGGEVRVEQNLPRGARFVLRLPVASGLAHLAKEGAAA